MFIDQPNVDKLSLKLFFQVILSKCQAWPSQLLREWQRSRTKMLSFSDAFSANNLGWKLNAHLVGSWWHSLDKRNNYIPIINNTLLFVQYTVWVAESLLHKLNDFESVITQYSKEFVCIIPSYPKRTQKPEIDLRHSYLNKKYNKAENFCMEWNVLLCWS